MEKKLLLVLLAIALLLTGCKKDTSSSSSSTSSSSTSSSSATNTSQTSSSSSSAAKTYAPPAQLDSVESNSEDIIDDIAKDDWTAAQSKASAIKASFDELKPILISAYISTDIIDGLDSAINALETAVTEKKSYDSRVQANQISKYVPDIADSYNTIPTDISRLDYFGREIILNVEKSDWTSASSNCETAGGLWSGLKSELKSTYNNDIDSFQSNMDSLKSAIDKKDSVETSKQANALLEKVDVLETDFTSQNKA